MRKSTFHHDENSPVLYSGGFSELFGLELTIFPDFWTKLHYVKLHITLHYADFMFKYDITQKEREMS